MLKAATGRRLAPKQMIEDLRLLKKSLEEIHPNLYHTLSRQKFAGAFEKALRKCARPLTLKQFSQVAARLVAGLRDGHTRIYTLNRPYQKYLTAGGRVLPLGVVIRGRKAVVERNLSRAPIPNGSALLSINGVEIGSIIGAAYRYLGTERSAVRAQWLKRQFSHYLWYAGGLLPPYTVRIRTGTGITTHRLAGISPEVFRKGRTGKGKPFVYRLYRRNRKRIAYVAVHSFGSRRFAAFERFLRKTFWDVRKKRIRHLIVDLRRNPGGSSYVGDLFFEYLSGKPYCTFSRADIKISKQLHRRTPYYTRFPAGKTVTFYDAKKRGLKKPAPNPLRFRGRLYVLVGVYTFSAAADFAAMIKDFNVGFLVGEETGGLATSYGDSFPITLPHSKLRGKVSYKYFVRPNGKDTGRGVLPDVRVTRTPADIRRGVDTVRPLSTSTGVRFGSGHWSTTSARLWTGDSVPALSTNERAGVSMDTA
jgi:hypothetical protein